MTTQNAKISRRSNRGVHHFNREGKDSFTPRKIATPSTHGAECSARNDKREVARNYTTLSLRGA